MYIIMSAVSSPTLLETLQTTLRDAQPFDGCSGSHGLRDWLKCEQCEREWTPPDLLRALSAKEGSAKEGSARRGAAMMQTLLDRRRRHAERASTPKMSWFICLSKPHEVVQASRKQNFTKRRQVDMVDYAKAAVLSALLNAPSLVPYVVYMHHPKQELQDDQLMEWLQRRGVRTVLHRLSFHDDLARTVADSQSGSLRLGPPTLDIGTFCRMDIPLLARKLAAEEDWAARRIDVNKLLYTDTDVLFAHDVDELLAAPGPRTFFAGTEVFSLGNINAGVMLMNISAMIEELPPMLKYARERRFHFMQPTQSWITEWFLPHYRSRPEYWKTVPHLTGWQPLQDGRWNARAFAHPHKQNPPINTSTTWVEPHLWHWHGYKARDIECWLQHINLDGNVCGPSEETKTCRPTGKPTPNAKRFVRSINCYMFEPLHKFWGACAYRTYLHLYRDFLRLIALADDIVGADEAAHGTSAPTRQLTSLSGHNKSRRAGAMRTVRGLGPT